MQFPSVSEGPNFKIFKMDPAWGGELTDQVLQLVSPLYVRIRLASLRYASLPTGNYYTHILPIFIEKLPINYPYFEMSKTHKTHIFLKIDLGGLNLLYPVY